MTLMEMAVSSICLAAGYALVSWLLDRGKPRRPPPSRDAPRDTPRDAPRPGGGSSRPAAAAAPEDWWTVLYLPANADLAAVKDAYRSLIAQYHPDKVEGMGPEIRAVAAAQSARINAAYEAAKRALKAGGR
jgi:DnaJ-domain-containing protein 1